MIRHTRSGTMAFTALTHTRASALPMRSMARAALSTMRRMASISMRALETHSVFLPSEMMGSPERLPAEPALDHELKGFLGGADGAHAVVDPARAEAHLGDLEPAALAEKHVLLGTRTSSKRMCMWPCGASSWPNTSMGSRISTPGVSTGTRICDCCRCAAASGLDLTITIMILQRGSPAPEM